MNFVHPATTRSTVVSVIHKLDRRRVLLATPIHHRLAVVKFCKSRVRGCRVAQLVKCLVTSGYPDGSSSGGPSLATLAREKTGKWKDLHPAVAKHDCPEINSSQRWCLCKKRLCGMEPRRPGQQQVLYL